MTDKGLPVTTLKQTSQLARKLVRDSDPGWVDERGIAGAVSSKRAVSHVG